MADNILGSTTKNQSYTRLLLILFIYLILAVLLTWPTATHLATHVPGDGGDDPAIAWNLWWFKHAILIEGQNPFQTDYMFYPIGINLAFYTLTVLNSAFALPLTLNLGVITASNLHMLFTFVAGGYGAFLVTRYVLSSTKLNQDQISDGRSPASVSSYIWLSAAIAGGMYAFASSKLFYVALGQFNIASNHWVPFTVLYVLRTRYEPCRLKNPLMAGLFFTLQAWAEMTYASFLLIFIGLYWLYWILGFGYGTLVKAVRTSVSSLILHVRAAALMTIIFAIGLSPILAQMLADLWIEGDFLVEGGGFADVFSADVLGLFIPTMHHPLLGHLITQTNVAFDKGQHIYVGFVVLGLTLASLRASYRRPEMRFWLLALVAFVSLSLGPVITINGADTGLKGPFIILQDLPFIKGNRYPSRYSVMLMLSLSVLTGFSLLHLDGWLRRKANYLVNRWPQDHLFLFYLLVAAIFLFEHLALPLPQSDMRVPAPYRIIASDPEDSAVLDIPFAWRNGFRITGALTTQFMFGQFYQTVHQKKLLQGNTSRNPEFKFQYFTNAPILNSLLALETGKTVSPERWESDRVIAAQVLRFFNIKYIIVRPDETDNPIVTPQATIPYIEDVLPVDKIHAEATLKIYRLINTTFQESGLKSDLLINTDTPLAPLYFGEGWGLLSAGQPIAAQRQKVRLLVPMAGGPQRVNLRIRLPDVYQAMSQSIWLELNGWQSPSQDVGRHWQEYSFELPEGVARAGLNNLYLHFADVSSVPSIDQSHTILPDVTVLSAGEEVGDFGHIFVNGYEISPNQRGYNVAIIQPDNQHRTTAQVASFDTHLDPEASSALGSFIETAPVDALIAIAAADEASLNLSEEAVQTLNSIGATGDLRGCFRCSHAIIGRKGAASTEVQEAIDLLRPVGLTTGLGLNEPTIAAVIDWVRIELVEE